MSTALKHAVEVIEALAPEDREQLKRYFSAQSGDLSKESESADSCEGEKWAKFWRVGDELASQLGPEESPSRILNEMRR